MFGQPLTNETTPRTLGRRDHLTFRGNIPLGRHGWLRLTPAYSLHLVRELLRQAGSDDLVLDPFSGTGTTPLACASSGIACHAVDINPFLVWLGNLKLTRFGVGTDRALRAAATGVAEVARRSDAGTWKPNLHAIEKWWDAPSLHALVALCETIRGLEQEQPDPVNDLLRIAFCRAMIQTANVSFGHQSMSFKKKGADESLIRMSDADRARRVIDVFLAAANEVAESLLIEPPHAECRVFLGDSQALEEAVPGCSYTAVITSPPYPNRMSYIREVRPYMYWLGYLSDGRAAGELDWRAIGGTWGCATSMLGTWKPNGDVHIPFASFDHMVAQIGRDHALLGRYVHKYFQDINTHILHLRGVIAPGARCHYIVGNSKFYDTLVPVEEIFAALFENAGFVGVRIETIRKRTSKKELYEFIVHANAPAKQSKRKQTHSPRCRSTP
ncbi:MAG: site-specific DNA-methyltransferase [Planctomycetes bacterium]|nr:site-specific DNA-methyltransferase [Planctomycetota bacterium]